MSMVSLGDMAQTFMLRGQITRIKGGINRTTEELASGQKADVAQSLGGDTTQLAALMRSKSLVESFQTSASDHAVVAANMQSIVGQMLELGEELASPLMTAAQSVSSEVFSTVGYDARARLVSAVNGLNTSIGGRYIMAGTATATPPLPRGEDFLTEVQSVVSGAATPQEVVSRLSDWFNGAIGYSDSVYGGGDGSNPVPVSRTDRVALAVTANDPDVRRSLHGLAVAAVLDDPSLSLTLNQRQSLAKLAIEELDAGNAAAVNVAARIGSVEQQIESAQTRNSAESLIFESRIAKDLEADPYSLATELEALQTNLEMVYSITARLSRLHLSDYL